MRKFILGTDWWTDCDDAVALRILARAQKRKEIKILGIGINAAMPYSVASLDGFLTMEIGKNDILIGIDSNAIDYGGNPPYQKRLSHYSSRYKCNEEARDAVSLYREILAKVTEKIEIIEIGYMNVIADVLKSEADEYSALNGIQLFKEKVSKVCGTKMAE